MTKKLPPLLTNLDQYPECDTSFSDKIIQLQKTLRKERKFLQFFQRLKESPRVSNSLLFTKTKNEKNTFGQQYYHKNIFEADIK